MSIKGEEEDNNHTQTGLLIEWETSSMHISDVGGSLCSGPYYNIIIYIRSIAQYKRGGMKIGVAAAIRKREGRGKWR